VPINDLRLGGANDAQVVANGNVSLSWAASTFEGTLDTADELDDFDAKVGLHGAMTIELAVESSGDLAGSLRLATIALPTFPAGPSIDVSPYVQVNLRLRGSADAGARVSLVAPFDIGMRFSGAESDGALGSAPRFVPEIGAPDLADAVAFDGVAELELSVVFLTRIEGFEVGGPSMGSAFGAALTVDPTGWDLDGLAKVVTGWAFRDPVTLLPNVPANPQTFEFPRWDIASAQTLPDLQTSTRWSEVFDIGGDDDAGAIVSSANGLRVLEAGAYSWLASLDGLGAPEWQDTVPEPTVGEVMSNALNGDLIVAGPSGRRDASGAPLWTRQLTVPGASRVTCEAMVPSPSNGIIIAGDATHGGSHWPILAAIDANGSVEWSTEVDMGLGSTSPEIHALALAPTGEIVAVGSVY
jgi:hypothetical protein